MKKYFRNCIVFIFFSVLIFTLEYCGNSTSSETNKNSFSKTYLNLSDTAHYVGMNTCKLCHQEIYNSFLKTGMGKSFEHSSKTKSSAKLTEHTVIYDKFKDFYYHPFWQNDSLIIFEFRLEGKDTIYKHVERVDFIVGSGQHTNSHIMNTNGYLHQMPMTYYTQKGTWDLPPGFENGSNTRFSRKIGLECMSCHNSFPDFVKGSENKFDSIPQGISCERCHGPGSIHVQQRSTGQRIDTAKEIDYSIVNPGKLPVDLQFDVCQRCHLQGNAVLKEGKSFFDFRPGMKLSDVMTTFLPRYKNADDRFIMASHSDRLKQSKCFINSYQPETDSKSLRPYKNALTCVSCHNPHISVKVTGRDVFNNTCKNCHNTSKQNKTCSEKPETLKQKENNCVGCHMPKSGSIDIPHVSVHDHYIRKPMKNDEVEKVKEFIGLFAINEKNPSNKTKAKAYIQQYDKFEYNPAYLDSAEIYLSSKTINDLKNNLNILIHLNFMKKNYSKIIFFIQQLDIEKVLTEILIHPSWSNDDAWALYQTGEAYYANGDINTASLFYKKADELSPFNPEFKNKVGALLMAQNRTQEAIVIFETILNEDSKFVPALTNLGYAMLISGNPKRAEVLYNRAIQLDPDYDALLMNIAGLNIYNKNYKEANRYLKRVLKINPTNSKARELSLMLKNQYP